MFDRTTSPDTDSAISSPESECGVTRCGSQDGTTLDLFGRDHAPASRSAPPANEAEPMTNDTSGQNGFDLSMNVDRPSFSENKSLAATCLDRQCKECDNVKPLSAFAPHNKGGHRRVCRDCANRKVRELKPWRSDAKRAYMRARRNRARGFALCNDARRRAKEKGLPFDLDPREIQTRINAGVCEMTGIAFDLSTPKGWNAPSLDQIVPRAGYTKENTRVVLYALNTMANDWGLDIVKRIVAALKR
jgi:hypothetical protein